MMSISEARNWCMKWKRTDCKGKIQMIEDVKSDEGSLYEILSEMYILGMDHWRQENE